MADARSIDDLISELVTIQSSTALLFKSFTEEMLKSEGVANGNSVYVKGIAFIILGHTQHHKKILIERYLQEKTISL